jgi:outer membrane lipoprotein-sorting protein
MKRLTFAAMVAASALLLNACGADSASGARGQVAGAFKSLDSNGPYRMRIESKSADTTDVQVVEVVPPGDLHIRIEGDAQGEPNEIVKIGTKAWIREGGGFIESTVSVDQEQSFTAAPFVASDFMPKTSDFVALADETIGAATAKVYTFVHTDPDGGKSNFKIWIDMGSNRPLKVEAVYPDISETYVIEPDPAIKIMPPQ